MNRAARRAVEALERRGRAKGAHPGLQPLQAALESIGATGAEHVDRAVAILERLSGTLPNIGSVSKK